MSKYLPYVIAALCGVMLTFSFAPYSYWWLTPVCLFVLFWQFLSKHPPSFYYGLSFGLGWFGAGVSWVHVSIANFGGLPLVGSLALMALLCGYLALFPALFFAILSRYSQTSHCIIASFPLWWSLEWLRSWFLTGFPWLSLGYSQVNGPLAGFIPLIGETGLSVLMVTMSFWLARQLVSESSRFISPPAITIVIVPILLGYLLTFVDWVIPKSNAPTISMVQGNIKQELRWAPEQDKPTMEKYLGLTEPYWKSDFIIWPEAAIPKLEPLAQDFLYELNKSAEEHQTALVTGIVNYNFETSQAFNNLIVLGKKTPDSEVEGYRYLHGNRYAKHHLLPIGEFIPMETWLRGLAPIFDLPMSSFTRGKYRQANLQVNGWNLAPAICFEIAFPRQILSNIHSNTDYIITVSNDAWFGRSHGPAQHLEIAQVRALELGIPVLRATNNGITAFIDHQGKVLAQAPQFEDAVLQQKVATTEGITPYRYWGDAPGWLFSLLMSTYILWSARQSNKSPIMD